VDIVPLLLPIGTGLAVFGLTTLSMPLLRSYALARPNHRSSHKIPTPQGGGMFIVAATIVLAGLAICSEAIFANNAAVLACLFAAALVLAVIGAIDDLRMLDARLRLVLQAAAITAVVAALPSGFRIVDALPWWVERACIVIALLWFVNLVNFMDGIDWMTVAEVVPVTAALALFGLMGALPRDATLISLALCGAVIGFAPFNRPVARLFLGDVGSLPIGLIVGWLLALLAADHLVAALLLPLYYLADATITLFRRLLRGERIMQAHRSHFYQCAMDSGMRVYGIVGRVFLTNIALSALAALALLSASILTQAICLVIGSVVVAALLWSFSRTATPHPA
jgi:UDP-N-acetylmuramyl pentapeptide phosphotransferase/UDP-N-acetylglucosamine-1-phosphate transferase